MSDVLTNIFSSDRLASQQFKNIGMNKFRNGGHSNWNGRWMVWKRKAKLIISSPDERIKYLGFFFWNKTKCFLFLSILLNDLNVMLTVNANGTVVTNSNIKWNDRICCQIFPCKTVAWKKTQQKMSETAWNLGLKKIVRETKRKNRRK